MKTSWTHAHCPSARDIGNMDRLKRPGQTIVGISLDRKSKEWKALSKVHYLFELAALAGCRKLSL
jgi:hypothetical protein